MKVDNSREGILKRLRAKVAEGKPIVGAGAGTGISAKCEEEAGVDLIIIYNSGRFRMAGRGSMAGNMPYGNANQIVLDMAPEVLTVVKHTPIIAGVCATDPFLLRDRHLRTLKDMGFSGIQNFPTVGLMDGVFRQNLEETGMSYKLEVECVARAREMDILTTPYVFNTKEAEWMAKAGADVLVAHMGLTVSGTIGAQTYKTLDQSVKEIQAMVDVIKSHRSDALVICHGGPIASPEDAQYIIDKCKGVDGFYGASSMERLPVEEGMTEHVKKFVNLKLKK